MEGDHSEYLGVDGRIKLKMNLQEAGWDMDSIDPTRDRDRWRAVVNAVMNIRFP